MLRWFKQITALFFLSGFLFTGLSEQIHALEHRNDSHCHEHGTIHFHEAEHHCFICDYYSGNSNEAVSNNYSSLVYSVSNQYSFFFECVAISHFSFHYSLRGPPFIS